MKLNSMRNQGGEVIIGAMAVICVVMMLFGGMHMMHGGHRSEADHQQREQKQNYDDYGAQHKHDHSEGQDPSQNEVKK